MTHPESRELLLDLAYGELSPLRAVELEAHLAGCAECQREKAALDEARRLSAPLREVEEPPEGFDDRILAAARAQAQLEHEGNIGQVIEAQGSVRPLGLEPAQVDAHAQVAPREEKRRPRWMVRAALGGSVAAAAALALVMSTSLQQKHEVDRAAQLAADKAFEIHIRPAPLPQAAGEAVRDAKKEEVARAQPAPVAAEQQQKTVAAAQTAPQRQSGEARASKRAAAPEGLGAAGALGGVRGGSGGDALDTLAAREPGPPPASAAAPQPPAATTNASAAPPAAVAPAARALAAPSPSAAGLEQQAQEARHGGDYPLAAILYRKAADLRRAEAPQGNEGAWDLAHAVECLAAAGRFDEARSVRDQLAQLFPAESSAFAAAGRVLREVDAPARRDSRPPAKAKSDTSTTVPADF